MIDEAIRLAIEWDSMLYNRKDSCPDHLRDRELRWIYHLAYLAPDGPGVEVGVADGGTLICWSLARKDRGEIIAIDIEDSPNLSDFDQFYQMPSAEAAKHIEPGIAFCFVDGDHSKAGIRADIEAWPGKMKPGGILAFHDYNSAHEPAVTEAVDGWKKECNWPILGMVGSLIAFRKPE